MDYFQISKEIRKKILKMIYRTQSPHIGACLSCIEILVVLYFKILKINPKKKKDKERDIFILSKGHAALALYAVLTERGFMKKAALNRFGVDNGLLEGHPTKNLEYGIEVSTGSLSHGLAIGAGMALARKRNNSKSRVFVLLSDGELQEGSVWETALFASHHKLDNLIAIVDYNKIQALDKLENIINLEPLRGKWQSFGWQAKEINGHDFFQLEGVLNKIPFSFQRPSVVIANTKKGKGVSFMENNPVWHSKVPDEKEFKNALKELS